MSAPNAMQIFPLRSQRALMLMLSILVVALSGCQAVTDALQARLAPPVRYRVEVLGVTPHDPGAFTQGLLLHEGMFYESTGLVGRSSLRLVDPKTGEVQAGIAIPSPIFSEGLALVGDRLIQITWQQQSALVFDLETFTLVDVFEYTGEGWGLCYDGEALYMSDGSAVLTRRDAATFAPLAQYPVTSSGYPVTRLNELECVGDYVYANIWFSDEIVQIDKRTGIVVGVIDASGLLTPEERAAADNSAVLNGIAYNPERQTFYLTGKLWPKMFEVRFVPRG